MIDLHLKSTDIDEIEQQRYYLDISHCSGVVTINSAVEIIRDQVNVPFRRVIKHKGKIPLSA